MSTNAFLVDAQLRHQIMIQRLSGGIWEDVDPVLQRMRDSIVARLASEPTDFQITRLNMLMADVNGMLKASLGEFSGQLQLGLEEFAEYETGFQGRMLGGVINVETVLPPVEQVVAAFTAEPAGIITGDRVDRLTIPQMMSQFSDKKSKEIMNIVRAGFIEGQTTDQIARQVSSRVTKRTRAQARALVRTATNHAASVARSKTMQANADVLEGEEWISTLDSNTTQTCFGLSGNIYPVGVGPTAPRHYNCRSLRAAKVKPEFSLFKGGSTRPAIGSDGVEQISTRKTFGGWLRGQPASFQDEFFGKFTDGATKRKLFNQGRLDPQQFIDPNGVALSLDELRRLEPQAFERAGL